MSVITLKRPKFGVEFWNELWVAVHEPEMQPRTCAVLGQQRIYVPVEFTAVYSKIWFFSHDIGGNLIQQGNLIPVVKAYVGETIVLSVRWETW